MVDAAFGLVHPGQDLGGHRVAGQVVAVGGQHHLPLAVGKEEVDIGALADQVHLAQDGLAALGGLAVLGFQSALFGLFAQAVPDVDGGSGGQVPHVVQGGKALLGKIAAKQHQLGQAHHGHAQDHQGGHGGKKGHRYAFAHY